MNAIATAVANIEEEPPRRRASATHPTTASVLATPIVTVMLAGLPKRAGIAISQ